METACDILKAARRIAVLGMSPRPHRTSHQIALYLQGAGYEIIPVNPDHGEILGLECYPHLRDVPGGGGHRGRVSRSRSRAGGRPRCA